MLFLVIFKRVGIPNKRPSALEMGVYWRCAFKREGRLYKKSILGSALKRDRVFIGENTVILYECFVL